MVFSGPLWQNTDRVSLCSLFGADWMMRGLATMGLMVESSRKVYATVRVLLLPDVGVRQEGEALMDLKTASWRTSTANYRSKLVMVPTRLVNLTSCGKCWWATSLARQS